MRIASAFVAIESGGSAMRTYVVRPRDGGPYPGLVAFSDIFQLTASTLRILDRIAGYGFVVAAPEIYHRIEPQGAAIAFDDAGRTRGMADAKATTAAQFDEDARAVVKALEADTGVTAGRIGAIGWCLGGHLAFRAAFLPEVRATACFYATGLHDGALGADEDAGSLERVAEIRGELTMVFGTEDPHVPEEGLEKIGKALAVLGERASMALVEAEHAFMRDEGPRYDPELTDRMLAKTATFFRKAFGISLTSSDPPSG